MRYNPIINDIYIYIIQDDLTKKIYKSYRMITWPVPVSGTSDSTGLSLAHMAVSCQTSTRQTLFFASSTASVPDLADS
jgi:hypothetical protein